MANNPALTNGEYKAYLVSGASALADGLPNEFFENLRRVFTYLQTWRLREALHEQRNSGPKSDERGVMTGRSPFGRMAVGPLLSTNCQRGGGAAKNLTRK